MRKVLLLGSAAVCLLMLLATLLIDYLRREYGEGPAIRRAIEAHGGLEAIRRVKAGRFVGAGVRHGGFGGPSVFAWEEAFAFPDRYRLMIRPKESVTVMYLAPAKTWWVIDAEGKAERKAGSAVMPASQFEPLRQLVEIEQQQLPITLMGDEEVGFRQAVTLRADSGSWGSVTYSFDKAKGLLLRMKGQLDRPDSTSVTVERVYSNHQPVDGVLIPMKVAMYVNGRLDTEMTIHSAVFVEQLDPSTFAPP